MRKEITMRAFRWLPVLAAVLAAVPVVAKAETWVLDPAHSAAQFSVRHLGISTVRGAFTKVEGTVQYSPSNPTQCVIEATIDANSVDTRVQMRDNDLRSAHFLDVAKYPTITFKSKSAVLDAPGKMKITGDLTIHGVTREVVLDVDGPTPAIKDPMGNSRMGASATTRISRKDFGITGAPGMVGDEISIVLDIELSSPATRQNPPASK
jgi:polyisoprenoid-binding protein YceI